MTILKSSSFLSSWISVSSTSPTNANIPRTKKCKISLPILQSVHEQELISYSNMLDNDLVEIQLNPATRRSHMVNGPDPLVIEKLYAIKEIIADRVEMHMNIGEQRIQWNNILLTSINGITLADATMVGIAASSGDSVLGLKMSSTLMYLAAIGMLAIINQIQPSQLAEKQKHAARLFQDLHNQIQTTLSISHPSSIDVKEAMDKVLAIDKAYPLPLLGVMLEKFPSSVETTVWWPQQRRRQPKRVNDSGNNWNGKQEEEMREIMGVGEKALKLNKFLAMIGPLLTGLAAVDYAFAGHSPHGSWQENREVFEMKVALKLGRSLSDLRNLAAAPSSKAEALEEFGSRLL
ncbi:unnamed protein product [Withania somnifera]